MEERDRGKGRIGGRRGQSWHMDPTYLILFRIDTGTGCLIQRYGLLTPTQLHSPLPAGTLL